VIPGASRLRIPEGHAPPFRAGTLRLLPADVAGELDTPLVDASAPRWTSSNLSEAFPGPMTVLSLGVSLDAMRAAADAFTRMIPLPADLTDASRHHMLASLAHTIYVNVGLLAASAAQAGQTPEEFEHELFGTPLPENYQRPRRTASDIASLVRLGAAMGPRVAGLGGAVKAHAALAGRRAAEAGALGGLDTEGLHRRFEELAGELAAAWAAANLATALVSQPMAALERRFGPDVARAARSGLDRIASAGAAHGVQLVAAEARQSPAALTALADPDPETRLLRVRRDAPAVAAMLDDVVRRYGHRGPGETELANRVYADDPALLLDAVAKTVDRPESAVGMPRELPPRAARLVKRTAAASERRERARDAVILLTHALRRTARELGRRLAASGTIDDPSDVFHLRRDELARPPADAPAEVARRRKERDRLAALRLPVVVDGPWSPSTTEAAVSLAGIAASGGTAVGRVRIVRHSLADLQPGEILVARVTDVGWTPFFAVAGAVVTDAGGLMAHAAVVARELGIPAVVGTSVATESLVDGQLVEVDGSMGTVTVL
jgi:phosphohistidine swiveling domain-containing protein